MKVRFYLCKPIYHPFPIVSWLIRISQGMLEGSHIAMDIDGATVFDATGKDSRFWSMSDFLERYEIKRTIEFDVGVDFKTMFKWSVKHANKKYSQWQILGILIKILLKLVGIKIKNPFGKDALRLICSEVMVLWLHDWRGVVIGDSDNYDVLDAWELGEDHVRNFK